MARHQPSRKQTMRKFAVLIAALFLALPALADTFVGTSGRDLVRLSTAVCTHAPVLSLIPEKYRSVVRDATAEIDGKTWRACWFVDGDSAHLLFEDGDQGLLPLGMFKLEKSA